MGTGTQPTSNEHLLQELEAISAVGIALASGRTDAEVLEVAGRTLPSFVDSMRVSVNLTTADGKHITIHPLFGPPDVVPTIVELENMLVEQAIQTRELIEVPDVGARSEPDAVWASGIGVRAVVVAPLVAAGECFGCINFSRSGPGHYRRHEIVLIRHIAATLAPALLSSRSKARAESATQALTRFIAPGLTELRPFDPSRAIDLLDPASR